MLKYARLLGAAAFLLAAAPAVQAQSSRGAIVGLVRDASGAVIPGAAVVVTNLGTNVSFRFETDDTGNYYVPSLIPGPYKVEASKEGFRKLEVAPVTVEVNQTVRVDLNLQVGQLAEAVEVSAAAQLVQTDTTTLGQVIGTRQVEELPLNGRDFTNLIRLNVGTGELTGGIATAGTIRRHGLNDNFRSISVNGARPSSTSYLIDGVSTNEALFQQASNIPPPDAIQEFKLQNSLYSAEFGMGAAQVNIALKSGTNSLHGSAWNFLRNDALQPRHPFYHTKSPLKQNQFGFTAGGPVFLPKLYNGKDKTFWFASYQGSKRRSGTTAAGQVPTEKQRSGDFSDWGTQLFDPLSAAPNPGGTPPVVKSVFPGNRIPADRFAPVSKNLLAYFPSATNNCLPPCMNYQRNLVYPVDAAQFSTRVDHNIGASDRIFGQVLYQNETAPSPALMPLSGTKVAQRGRLVGLQWSHIINPSTINEVRAGYNRLYFLSGFETAFGSINYWKEAGLKNLNDNAAYYALPAINMATSQYTQLGSGGSVPFYNISNIYHFVEALTLTRGRHSLKIGGEVRRGHNMNQNGFQGNGLLTFTGAYTARNPLGSQSPAVRDAGNAFADFLLGFASSEGHTGFDQSFARLRNVDAGFYFQDDFRVTPQLTLNLGVRWEIHTPYKDKFGGGSIFDHSFPGGRQLYRDRKFAEQVNDPIGVACCAKDGLVNTSYRSWAPRIGIAWRPFGNNNAFVVRAGYGIFYDVWQAYYPTLSNGQNQLLADAATPTPTLVESTPPLDIRNLFPAPYNIAQTKYPGPYCTAPAEYRRDPLTGATLEVLNRCYSGGGMNPNNKDPYIQQWGVNLQYEPVRNLLLEVGYQGSHGLRVPIRWVFNQAVLPAEKGNPTNSVRFISQCPPGTYPDKCSPYQERVPFRNFSPTSNEYSNIAQSVYHAMTVKVDKRFSHGLQALVAFTWSRAIDQGSEQSLHGGSYNWYPQYSYDLSAERGVASFDQTRRLVTSWVYELPFGKGKAIGNSGGPLHYIIGGWQANGILTLSDGSPFNVSCLTCGDRSQIGFYPGSPYGAGLRPNVNGNPLPSGFQRSYFNWFDASVFSLPELGTLGTSPRNPLRTPGQRALDFSMVKNNRIKERYNLQFRAEFFNAFSGHFYSMVYPGYFFGTANFGKLYSPGQDEGVLFNPRIIQFAMKLYF